MTSLPDSVPYNIKVSFLEYQRKEWEKVLESYKSNSALEDQPDSVQHWANVNTYALKKIKEIDSQLEELKLGFGGNSVTSDIQLIKK
jgi:hypothetical protein